MSRLRESGRCGRTLERGRNADRCVYREATVGPVDHVIDVGLLASHAGMPVSALVHGDEAFEEFKGALTEQYVSQELTIMPDVEVFYWSADRAEAEVDFLVQRGNGHRPHRGEGRRESPGKKPQELPGQVRPSSLLPDLALALARGGLALEHPSLRDGADVGVN
jgi:hypothetical protein